MAVLVIAQNAGGSTEQDEAMLRQMDFAGDRPAGNLVRAAGPVEGGWRVVSIWESQEAFDTFRRERLEPALRQAGRQVPQFQVSPLHSVSIAPQR